MNHLVAGTGALGGTLAAALARAEFPVSALASRPGAGLEYALPTSGILWLCIPDRAIPEMVSRLTAARNDWSGWTVIHTAGALGLAELNALQDAGARVASVHFLQTFVRAAPEPDRFKDILATVLTPESAVYEDLAAVLEKVGCKVVRVSEDEKARIHTAAVFVSNFWVILAGMAGDVLKNLPLSDPMQVLAPLMRQTAVNLSAAGNNPLEVLSGPLRRGDAVTLKKHLDLLANYPEAQALYRELTAAGLAALRKNGMEGEAHSAIRTLLDNNV